MTRNAMALVAIETRRVPKLLSVLFRDFIAYAFRPHRTSQFKRSKRCPICNRMVKSQGGFDSIHMKDYDRATLTRRIVKKSQHKDFRSIIDFHEADERFKEYHRAHAIVAIGCKKCHTKYDKGELGIFPLSVEHR